MHSLLAISSLHVARFATDDKERFLIAAASHQDLALPAYRYALANLEREKNEDRGRAMVASASLTIVYALLCPRPGDQQLSEGKSALARLSESISLLRGARIVLNVVGECIEGCTLASSVQAQFGDIDTTINPEDDRLASLQQSLLDQNEHHDLVALRFLRWCFAMLFLPSDPINTKRAINIWIESVPEAFLEGLRGCRPTSLVVLAHWCIMLKRAEMYWYLQDSAYQVLSDIHNVLADSWKERIAWPLQIVHRL